MVEGDSASSQSSQAGQSLVEASIAFVGVLVLLLGLLDLGRMYFTLLALQNAAGEGALYASAHPDCRTSAQCPDPNNVEYRVKHESSGGLLNWSAAVVTVQPDNPTTGGTIAVTVRYDDFKILTPVIVTIVGSDTLSLSARAEERVVGAP